MDGLLLVCDCKRGRTESSCGMYAATLFRSRAVGKGQGDWFVTGGRPSRAVALRTWTPSRKPRVVGRIAIIRISL